MRVVESLAYCTRSSRESRASFVVLSTRPQPAIVARRHGKVGAKCPAKRLVIPVAAFQSDFQNRSPTYAKLEGSPFEAQSIHTRLRRFAGHASEELVEVIFGELHFVSQQVERQVLIQMGLNVNERGNDPGQRRLWLRSAHVEGLWSIARIVKNSFASATMLFERDQFFG